MYLKETVIKLNKELGEKGRFVNESALEFAISKKYETDDWLEQLAYLVRAILIDHVFEDGNKRTSLAVVIGTLEGLKLGYDPQKLEDNLIKILKENITDIKKIKRLIKDVIR
ncbi:MAG: hypothetical protein AABW46_04600 [Nanoarchaeota archaeon]